MNEMTHTILFNDRVFFVSQVGAWFYNSTIKACPISCYSNTPLPAKMITYHVKWEVDPKPGDQIEWEYDGHGNYKNDYLVPLQPQLLEVINCADFTDEEAVTNKNK